MKKIITTAAAGLSSPYEDAERDLDVALVDYSHGDRIGKPMVFSSTEFNEGLENADEDVKELINAGGTGPTLIPIEINPKTSTTDYDAPEGYAYNKVIANKVTADIDGNITAENIKKDVTILGVTGSYEASGSGQSVEDLLKSSRITNSDILFTDDNRFTYNSTSVSYESEDVVIDGGSNGWIYHPSHRYRNNVVYNYDATQGDIEVWKLFELQGDPPSESKLFILDKTLTDRGQWQSTVGVDFITDIPFTGLILEANMENVEVEEYRVSVNLSDSTCDTGETYSSKMLSIYTPVYNYDGLQVAGNSVLQSDSLNYIKTNMPLLWDAIKNNTLNVEIYVNSMTGYNNTWFSGVSLTTIDDYFTNGGDNWSMKDVNGESFKGFCDLNVPYRTFYDSIYSMSLLQIIYSHTSDAPSITNVSQAIDDGILIIEKWDETDQQWVVQQNPFTPNL